MSAGCAAVQANGSAKPGAKARCLDLFAGKRLLLLAPAQDAVRNATIRAMTRVEDDAR
jgi:hypothetical protein